MMAPETVVVDHNKPAGQQAPPQQQGGSLDWIKPDIEYFKSVPGLLKIVQLVLGILCMALSSSWVDWWFVFVAVTSFITTLLWTFVYLLSVKQALSIPINWALSELISVGVETFFYLTAFITMFSKAAYYSGYYYGSNTAAAVFGMFNTVAYGFAAFLLWKEHKAASGTGTGSAA